MVNFSINSVINVSVWKESIPTCGKNQHSRSNLLSKYLVGGGDSLFVLFILNLIRYTSYGSQIYFVLILCLFG